MIHSYIFILALGIAAPAWADQSFVATLTKPTTDFSHAETGEANPGGTATVPRRSGRMAFSAPSANLSAAQEVDFKLGNALFRQQWQAGNSGIFSGLGPDFNARSCQQCHVNDGRGSRPETGYIGSILLKTGIPEPLDRFQATHPDPNYGTQLQDFNTTGAAELSLQIRYTDIPVTMMGGQIVHLRQPNYQFETLAHGPLHKDSRISARVAPQMIGLGLIEAIAEVDILAGIDPQDTNNDGISGRANRAISLVSGQPMLGRFGLKAASPSIHQQTALAFAHDMGISNSLLPRAGEPLEISTHNFDFTAEYSAQLGVPARTQTDENSVLQGKKLFYNTGCIACHTPKFFTLKLPKRPALSAQLIWPYSDFLLHDMGDGLADGFPEGRATGAEWRTPPLWGIGLSKEVNPRAGFLHDGRARTLLEAVLWHGGEAQSARDKFTQMPRPDRDALIRFLESL